jgi:uncharacterized protein YegP (UPF0339 family)
MKLHVYKDAAGEWRWRVQANNNRTVADSSEGYTNRQDAIAGFALIRTVSPDDI